MMRLYKLGDEVFGYAKEGSIEMSENEVLRHASNPNIPYFTWDADKLEWLDSRSPEQILEHNRSLMSNLTKREFRAKLRDAQLFDQVEAYVKAGDGYLQDAWEYSDFFARLDPFIVQAGNDLGLTPETIDHIWLYGKLPDLPVEE